MKRSFSFQHARISLFFSSAKVFTFIQIEFLIWHFYSKFVGLRFCRVIIIIIINKTTFNNCVYLVYRLKDCPNEMTEISVSLFVSFLLDCYPVYVCTVRHFLVAVQTTHCLYVFVLFCSIFLVLNRKSLSLNAFDGILLNIRFTFSSN